MVSINWRYYIYLHVYVSEIHNCYFILGILLVLAHFWWPARNYWIYDLLSLFTRAFLAWRAPMCLPSFQFPYPVSSHSNPHSTVTIHGAPWWNPHGPTQLHTGACHTGFWLGSSCKLSTSWEWWLTGHHSQVRSHHPHSTLRRVALCVGQLRVICPGYPSFQSPVHLGAICIRITQRSFKIRHWVFPVSILLSQSGLGCIFLNFLGRWKTTGLEKSVQLWELHAASQVSCPTLCSLSQGLATRGQPQGPTNCLPSQTGGTRVCCPLGHLWTHSMQ